MGLYKKRDFLEIFTAPVSSELLTHLHKVFELQRSMTQLGNQGISVHRQVVDEAHQQ